MRPTKGEIKVTPASAHATAWAKLKRSVGLQWMPSFSKSSVARMPSQVLAILIRMRSRATPSFSCIKMSRRALAIVPGGIEAQSGCDLSRDAAGDHLENLKLEKEG